MNWVRECSVDSLQCSGICVLSCHAERSDSVVKHLLILRLSKRIDLRLFDLIEEVVLCVDSGDSGSSP